MQYIIAQNNGDSITVPITVINQLERLPKNKEVYFRIALCAIASKNTNPISLSQLLCIDVDTVEKSLDFWHGAGLLCATEAKPIVLEAKLPRLTTKEVFEHSKSDNNISVLLLEAQQIFGEVIGQSEANILVSLYINNHMPVDYLLTGLAYFKANGLRAVKMKSIEARFLKWHDMGIKTTDDIENYLRLLDMRSNYEKQVSEILHVSPESFTYKERCKISQWFEEYKYTEPMISQAAVAAGEKSTVAYIGGILKKWYAKGYRQVRDVLAGEGGSNASTVARTISAEQDILARRRGIVPKFEK